MEDTEINSQSEDRLINYHTGISAEDGCVAGCLGFSYLIGTWVFQNSIICTSVHNPMVEHSL